jgi:hypothetical protein
MRKLATCTRALPTNSSVLYLRSCLSGTTKVRTPCETAAGSDLERTTKPLFRKILALTPYSSRLPGSADTYPRQV